jgi:muramoyltetrapeptide carboxypeptidase
MFKQPPFLQKNSSVALIATAKNFDEKELTDAITILSTWGLKVKIGSNAYKNFNQFAGTDSERLQDLQWALDDNTIEAVFCIRGGYGTARIIDIISFKRFQKNPKWVIGFSDVTTLHASIQKLNIQSIHGLMPITYGQKEYLSSLQKLKETLFRKKLSYKIAPNHLNTLGTASAPIIGGNLSIICSLLGTNNELETKNKILFIEDVGENLYRIDRMVIQLKRAGILKALKGVVVGHFTNMEDNKIPFGKNAYEIIQEAIAEYDYPVCFGFPAGHEAENMPITLGATVELSVKKTSVSLLFK